MMKTDNVAPKAGKIRVDTRLKLSEIQRRTVSVGADRLEIRAMSDEGRGQFTGKPALFGSINDRGEIHTKGEFANCKESFTRRGFIADSHDAMSYRGMLGYPISAEEKEDGLECTAEFHSTPHAQEVRTIVQERLDAGKQVSLSIGFYIIRCFYIQPRDYERELPKYLRGSRDEVRELINYAKNFTAIRVIQEADLVEFSVVTIPSEYNAQALDVRAMNQNSTFLTPELRSKYLGSNAEESASISVVYNMLDRLVWYCLYDVLFDTDKTVDEKLAIVTEAFDEARDISLTVIRALLSSKSPEETRAVAEALRTNSVNPELADFVEVRKSFTFEKSVDLTKQALANLSQRAATVTQLRIEQGLQPVVSPRMSENLTELCSAFAEASKLFESLLTNSTPQSAPEQSTTGSEAESANAQAEAVTSNGSAEVDDDINSRLLRFKRDQARQKGVSINV